VMSNTVAEIVNLLDKRRERLRGWVEQDSHPLVIDRVRDAHAALGAMTAILKEMAPALSRLLIDSIDAEQRMQSLRDAQRMRDQAKARQSRLDAQAEEDPEQAALLEIVAKAHERGVDAPDLSEVWAAGVLLTASKLYRTADQVSRSRDAEAIKTLGLKALGTAGKWALKLTPVRQEDLQDLKDIWDALKTLKEPLDDATAILEAGKLRAGQAKAASSLFERLQVVQEVAEAWCRTALEAPFLADAIEVDDPAAALRDRLQRSRQEWA
jgi:hypothetical protein